MAKFASGWREDDCYDPSHREATVVHEGHLFTAHRVYSTSTTMTIRRAKADGASWTVLNLAEFAEMYEKYPQRSKWTRDTPVPG